MSKNMEKSILKNELVVYTDNAYSNDPFHHIPLSFSMFYNNQHYIMDAPTMHNPNAPLYTQPTITRFTQ